MSTKKTIYKFPAFKGQDGSISVGYTGIAIKNGEAAIDESDFALMELVRVHGGTPISATKKPGGKK